MNMLCLFGFKSEEFDPSLGIIAILYVIQKYIDFRNLEP